MKLKCPHCGHIWEYTGKRRYYITCPNCLYKVPFIRDEWVANVVQNEEIKNKLSGYELIDKNAKIGDVAEKGDIIACSGDIPLRNVMNAKVILLIEDKQVYVIMPRVRRVLELVEE